MDRRMNERTQIVTPWAPDGAKNEYSKMILLTMINICRLQRWWVFRMISSPFSMSSLTPEVKLWITRSLMSSLMMPLISHYYLAILLAFLASSSSFLTSEGWLWAALWWMSFRDNCAHYEENQGPHVTLGSSHECIFGKPTAKNKPRECLLILNSFTYLMCWILPCLII